MATETVIGISSYIPQNIYEVRILSVNNYSYFNKDKNSEDHNRNAES